MISRHLQSEFLVGGGERRRWRRLHAAGTEAALRSVSRVRPGGLLGFKWPFGVERDHFPLAKVGDGRCQRGDVIG